MKGHTEPYCIKKRIDDKKKNKKSKNKKNEGGLILMAHCRLKKPKISEDMWIANSRASMHATNSKKSMFDTACCDVKITIRDRNGFKAIIKGKKQLTLIQPNDKAITVTI